MPKFTFSFSLGLYLHPREVQVSRRGTGCSPKPLPLSQQMLPSPASQGELWPKQWPRAGPGAPGTQRHTEMKGGRGTGTRDRAEEENLTFEPAQSR